MLSLKFETIIPMDKPVTWTALIRLIGIGIVPFIIFLWGLSRASTEHGVEIKEIKSNQERNNTQIQNKLDNVDSKLDRIMYKQEYKK